ncbi:hypothetical protein ACO2Q9_10615 [Variovorax sp. VNK109]|uniref:hypothetical protein n=1 Tax=Variovorax sp. VNK109 TaxID=3400919 RepID=UPI003C0F261B
MKKPSRELFERQARLARYSLDKRANKTQRHVIPVENRYVRPGELIVAPRKFDAIRASGRETVKFLRAVAQTILRDQQPTVLDFRHTESFYPVSTIYLYAELDRIVSLSHLPKPITIIDPHRRRAREVLKQIGLHEITGDSCDIIPEREDVVYWKASKGKDQSGEKLAILEVVAEKVNKAHARHMELSGIWRGVSEAVANSVDHAYKVPRADGFNGLPETRWWMFTQLRDGIFTAAVCDLGCGYKATIAQTIPEKFISELANLLVGTNRDSIAIHTAMEYGRSGTHQSERGKGSRDALSVLRKHGNGDLMILSNTGWIQYTYANGREQKKIFGDLGIDIRGTIIWWKLPVGDQE